jgi:hypothetical protein
VEGECLVSKCRMSGLGTDYWSYNLTVRVVGLDERIILN